MGFHIYVVQVNTRISITSCILSRSKIGIITYLGCGCKSGLFGFLVFYTPTCGVYYATTLSINNACVYISKISLNFFLKWQECSSWLKLELYPEDILVESLLWKLRLSKKTSRSHWKSLRLVEVAPNHIGPWKWKDSYVSKCLTLKRSEIERLPFYFLKCLNKKQFPSLKVFNMGGHVFGSFLLWSSKITGYWYSNHQN